MFFVYISTRLLVPFELSYSIASVRTRNALHEVGADLTRDDRYPTDLEWPRASARASEPQPHIYQFLIISYILLFSII